MAVMLRFYSFRITLTMLEEELNIHKSPLFAYHCSLLGYV